MVFACIVSILQAISRLMIAARAPAIASTFPPTERREKRRLDLSLPFSLISLWPELRHVFLHLTAGEARKCCLYFVLQKLWILLLWNSERKDTGKQESATGFQLPSMMVQLFGFSHVSAFLLIL